MKKSRLIAMYRIRKKITGYCLSACISVLMFGCSQAHDDKEAQKPALDPCVKEAGELPRPEYGFKGVRFEEIYGQKAVDACSKRLGEHPDDAYAKTLLARALTKQKEYDEAFVLLESSCAMGDDAGCTLLGSYYLYGFKKRIFDRKRAAELYKEACSNGYPLACLNQGKMYLTGEGIEKDPLRGAEMIYKECEGGFVEACHHYANSAHFKMLPINEDKYLFASQKVCEAGVDCTEYWDLIEKKKDDVSTALVTEKACKNGLAEACEKLATYYYQGRGVKADMAKSLALYKQACSAGRQRFACWYAGSILYNEGKDKKEAANLISQACHAGENQFACRDLDAIYQAEPSLASHENNPDKLITIEIP